jgi:Kinesin motor domain
MSAADISFDSQDDIADVNSIIADFPIDGDDDATVSSIPVKKLEGSFDTIAKNDTVVSQLRVFLRVRPISGNLESTITVHSDVSIVTTAPEISNRAKHTKMEERSYNFNRVFGPSSTQEDVFGHSVEPLLSRFLCGENCVLIAYGMTNAGKTHTIQGTAQSPGSLPKLVQEIFKRPEVSSGCDLRLSILEIYQEDVFDLTINDNKKKDKLKIRDINGRMEVAKLSSHQITSSTEASKLMDIATTNRYVSKMYSFFCIKL